MAMMINPSDAAFMKRVLERHLARQRSWPWIRYVLVVSGVVLVAFGAWLGWVAPSLNAGLTENTLTWKTPARVNPPPTEPVTQSQLWMVLQSSDQKSEMEAQRRATIASALLFCSISAMVNLFLGCYLIVHTLARWHYHRRDAILIALLRESCPELAS
jgi:hypothetical protein